MNDEVYYNGRVQAKENGERKIDKEKLRRQQKG